MFHANDLVLFRKEETGSKGTGKKTCFRFYLEKTGTSETVCVCLTC